MEGARSDHALAGRGKTRVLFGGRSLAGETGYQSVVPRHSGLPRSMSQATLDGPPRRRCRNTPPDPPAEGSGCPELRLELSPRPSGCPEIRREPGASPLARFLPRRCSPRAAWDGANDNRPPEAASTPWDEKPSGPRKSLLRPQAIHSHAWRTRSGRRHHVGRRGTIDCGGCPHVPRRDAPRGACSPMRFPAPAPPRGPWTSWI